jgi:hypothetical protein
MDDAVYKEQLAKFGTEAVRIVKPNLSKKRQEQRQEATQAVIAALMDKIEGRQWLYIQLDVCGVFATPFAPGKADVTAYLCGLQDMGHKLLGDIMATAPEQFHLMLQEENGRRLAASRDEDSHL